MRFLPAAVAVLLLVLTAAAQDAPPDSEAKPKSDRSKLIENHWPKPPPRLTGVQNLTAQQLQAIAAKPHTNRLDLPQMHRFPKPGTYRIFLTFHPADGERVKAPPHDATMKWVDGRYIVSSAQPNLDLPATVIIVTYDTSSACYRKWMLFGDRVIHQGVGVAGRGATTIAWWTRMVNPAGSPVSIISQESLSKDTLAWTSRIFDQDRFASREVGRAVRLED